MIATTINNLIVDYINEHCPNLKIVDGDNNDSILIRAIKPSIDCHHMLIYRIMFISDLIVICFGALAAKTMVQTAKSIRFQLSDPDSIQKLFNHLRQLGTQHKYCINIGEQPMRQVDFNKFLKWYIDPKNVNQRYQIQIAPSGNWVELVNDWYDSPKSLQSDYIGYRIPESYVDPIQNFKDVAKSVQLDVCDYGVEFIEAYNLLGE